MDHPVIRYGLCVGTMALLQYALVSQFRLLGVSVDVLLVLAIAAGIHSGRDRGAIVGFACGLALDLMVVTPFGLGAVSYLTAAVVASLMADATVHAARRLLGAVALVAAAVGTLVFALGGAVLGQTAMFDGHLPVVAVVVSVSAAGLVFPVLRMCRWADPEEHRIRAAAR